MSFSLMCGTAPSELPGAPWCDDCGQYGCQCDRDYAAYLEAWIEAVERGEFDIEMCPIGHTLTVVNTGLEAA